MLPVWGRCTTHFSFFFFFFFLNGDWDVHWGYGILTHGLTALTRKSEIMGYFMLRSDYSTLREGQASDQTCSGTESWSEGMIAVGRSE